MKTKNVATGFAILAAALYAVNIPFSKVLLQNIGPVMLAAFLYLGAGIGLLLYSLICRLSGKAVDCDYPCDSCKRDSWV